MKNLRRLFSHAFILMGLALLIPISSGCSKGVEQENTFLELLNLLPATARGSGGVALIDYELFKQANGISLDTIGNQKISRENFLETFLSMIREERLIDLEALSFGSYHTGWSRYALTSPIKDEYIGYNITDVDAEINNINVRPLHLSSNGNYDAKPDLLVAAIGDFNPQDTREALINHDGWPSWAHNNYTSENYNNITIHNWGDGSETHLIDKFSPPHLDNVGRARPLAVTDRYLFVGSSVKNVESMIDASQDKAESLADIPEYALVAQGIYDLGAYSAIIADEAMAKGYWENPDIYTENKLRTFSTFGTGSGRDEIGVYIALVLVHESSDKSIENTSLLEQLIGDTFEEWLGTWSWSNFIYDTEIYAKEKVLLAKLYTDDESLWRTWFIDQLPLLPH